VEIANEGGTAKGTQPLRMPYLKESLRKSTVGLNGHFSKLARQRDLEMFAAIVPRSLRP
jgi:hypothetical protein